MLAFECTCKSNQTDATRPPRLDIKVLAYCVDSEDPILNPRFIPAWYLQECYHSGVLRVALSLSSAGAMGLSSDKPKGRSLGALVRQ